MIVSLRHFLGWLVSVFRSREDLILENLALRRQLLALHAQQPRRRLTALHKLFWVAWRTFWSGWTKPLILVTPRTVVNWHAIGQQRSTGQTMRQQMLESSMIEIKLQMPAAIALLQLRLAVDAARFHDVVISVDLSL